jgi:hypothetical protein
MLLVVLWATIIPSVVEVDAASSAQRPSKYYKRIHERRGTTIAYPKISPLSATVVDKEENYQPKRSLQETVAPLAPTMAPKDTKSPKLSKSPKDTKAPKDTKSVKSTKAPKSTEPTVKTNVQLLSSTSGTSKQNLVTTSVVGVSAAALLMSI